MPDLSPMWHTGTLFIIITPHFTVISSTGSDPRKHSGIQYALLWEAIFAMGTHKNWTLVGYRKTAAPSYKKPIVHAKLTTKWTRVVACQGIAYASNTFADKAVHAHVLGTRVRVANLQKRILKWLVSSGLHHKKLRVTMIMTTTWLV